MTPGRPPRRAAAAPHARLRVFAATLPGLERVVAHEMAALGLGAAVTTSGGVEFEADPEDLWRANLELRSASRVLLRLASFRATTFDELRRRAAQLPWERFIAPGEALRLRVTCRASRLYHSGAVAERVAAAAAERLGFAPAAATPEAEDPDEAAPDAEGLRAQLVLVRLDHDRCIVSADSSGALLHRRGYRKATGKAPLRETLAAALLLASGWDARTPLLDPFCGAGTIAIEAALLARERAPGRARRFAFMAWRDFDAAGFARILAEADARAAAAPPHPASRRDAGRPIPMSSTHTPAPPVHPAASRGARAPAGKPAGPHLGRLDWRTLLRWLAEDALISAADGERLAQRFGAGSSSQHALVRLGAAGLQRAGSGAALDTEALTEWLARRCGLPYLRIDPLRADVGRVADVMSAAYAESRCALPVQVTAAEVVIATAEPFDAGWVPEIEAHTKRRVRLMVANPVELRKYTTEFYALAKSVRAAQKSGEVSTAASFEQLVELGKTAKQLDANDAGVVQVVDWLWQYAFDQRASDIHLEPRRELGAIRFRIDGVLHTVYQLPLGVMNAMVARIKLLGRMDVVERRRPLDGRIKTKRPDTAEAAGAEVEMRLSTLPTAFGEKLVMRIFDPQTAVKRIEQLGFGAHEAEGWRALMQRPHGIVLVTGPTGSGKTTTLYSTLKALATDEVNVCTIEDPIEMIEPAFNQTQVQPAVDLGFAEGLRALMRQDPDIIMVGEIRDLETAEMAIQAALTGHLVFSTLHTNDAAAAITRLADLGVPPYLISATVIGVLAQRLVRLLCPACKQRDETTTRETLDAIARPWRLSGGVRPYRPVGCLDCRHTGYRGRSGLYELLLLTEAARGCVHPTLDVGALRRQGMKDGMRALRLAGAMLVAQGQTTIDEVLRSTPSLDARG